MKNKNFRVAIVGCAHGDEVIGKKIIEGLKRFNLPDSVCFFIANPEALAQNKRFLEKDLNRSFPGDLNGSAEEIIAYNLVKQLSEFNLVLDIHATDSDFFKTAIITSLDEKTKGILKIVPMENILLCGKKVFGGNDLITHTRLGVSLEYGPNKSGENYRMGIEDIMRILINLGLIAGEKKFYREKNIFNVFGMFRLKDKGKFLGSDKLKDFYLMPKGEVVGKINDKEVISEEDFYPIFTGEGMYKDGFLMARKEYIKI